MAETFSQFIANWGRPEADYPTFALSASKNQAAFIVSFAGKTVLINAVAVAAGAPNEHLCLDIHSFADGHVARAAVQGMENGRRYPGLDDTTPGTSHGLPAARCLSVLIGQQQDRAR